MISKNISINQKEVERFKKTKKQHICSNLEEIDFLELSEEYLCELSFGSYQLKQ